MTAVCFYVLQPIMADTFPKPFGEEMKGIAEVSGVPLGKKTHIHPIKSLLFKKFH